MTKSSEILSGWNMKSLHEAVHTLKLTFSRFQSPSPPSASLLSIKSSPNGTCECGLFSVSTQGRWLFVWSRFFCFVVLTIRLESHNIERRIHIHIHDRTSTSCAHSNSKVKISSSLWNSVESRSFFLVNVLILCFQNAKNSVWGSGIVLEGGRWYSINCDNQLSDLLLLYTFALQNRSFLLFSFTLHLAA